MILANAKDSFVEALASDFRANRHIAYFIWRMSEFGVASPWSETLVERTVTNGCSDAFVLVDGKWKSAYGKEETQSHL